MAILQKCCFGVALPKPVEILCSRKSQINGERDRRKNDPWGGAEDLVDEVRQDASDDAWIAPRAAIIRAVRNAACNAN
jgi:hypothetical protein